MIKLFLLIDSIRRWILEYLSRAWLLYDIFFYDNLFVKAVLFLLLCLDVYVMINYEDRLKADVIEVMSLLIWAVCGAAYFIYYLIN
jgi:hypothetical protein